MKPTPQAANKLAKAVRDSLESLKRRRPIFHSEGDLRHELAGALQCEGGIREVRAEWPFKLGDPQMPLSLDILAGEKPGDMTAKAAIALKYPTDGCEVNHKGEKFKFPSVSVDIDDRRKFWEDAWRVERLVCRRDSPIVCGFAILLTNRAGFWDENRKQANPATHEGGEVKSFARCHDDRDKRRTLKLRRARVVRWKDWSDFKAKNGVFRCAIVEMRKP